MSKLVWRAEWGLLAACALIPTLTFGLSLIAFPLWVPLWAAEFKILRSTVMLGYTATSLVSILAAPLAGRLLISVSARWLMIGGALAMTAGFLLAAVASSFWMVAGAYATLIAVGAAFAGLLPAQTVALRRFPERAGAIGGLLAFILSVGGAVAPLVVGMVLAAFGWRTVFVGIGVVISAVTLPVAWLFLKTEPGPAPKLDEAIEFAGGIELVEIVGVEPATPRARDVQPVLTQPAFWLILVAIVPIMLGLSSISPNLAAMASDAGLGLGAAGYLIAGMAAGSAIGGVVVGWLADRIEPKLIFAAMTGLMLGGLAMVVLDPRLLMLPGMVLFGLSAGGVMPFVGVVILRRFGPKDFPRVQGLVMLFIAPAIVGSIAAGWIRDVTGSYEMALVGIAVLLLPGVAAVWSLGGASIPAKAPPSLVAAE